MKSEPLNVLVVYATLSHPIRTTIEDHLRAFERAGHRTFYLNVMVRRPPRWLLRLDFDLIVYHTTFLAQRWVPRHFDKVRRRAAPIARLDAPKVALPQDEFLRTDDVADFVREAGVDVVASVAPPAAWPVAYPTLDRDRVRLHQILTGYLDDTTVARIGHIVAGMRLRPIDVGYRAWRAEPWLGRHGQLKAHIADAARAAAIRHGMSVDISSAAGDQIIGDGWFRFLASCRSTVGVEGGASICDRDGSVKAATEAFLARHPAATFEEIEANCFPGRDGELPLSVLSPRHLEACATRTCQILIEGEYNGVLRPGEHYLSVRRDLADLDDALRAAADPAVRAAITEAAYRDVVASGRWTYERMVADVVAAALGAAAHGRHETVALRRAHRRARAFERRTRGHVVVKGRALDMAVRTLGPAVRRSRRLRAMAMGR